MTSANTRRVTKNQILLQTTYNQYICQNYPLRFLKTFSLGLTFGEDCSGAQDPSIFIFLIFKNFLWYRGWNPGLRHANQAPQHLRYTLSSGPVYFYEAIQGGTGRTKLTRLCYVNMRVCHSVLYYYV